MAALLAFVPDSIISATSDLAAHRSSLLGLVTETQERVVTCIALLPRIGDYEHLLQQPQQAR